jgi:hypothetical protein
MVSVSENSQLYYILGERVSRESFRREKGVPEASSIPLLDHLRKTNVFERCNPAVAMVPSIAEKLVPLNDKIYTVAQGYFSTVDFLVPIV